MIMAGKNYKEYFYSKYISSLLIMFAEMKFEMEVQNLYDFFFVVLKSFVS